MLLQRPFLFFRRCRPLLLSASLLGPMTTPFSSAHQLLVPPPPRHASTVDAGGGGAESGPVVWQYDFAATKAQDDGSIGREPVALPDGRTGLRITTHGGEWNTCLFLPPGTLKGGHDYTAIATYQVLQPPQPGSHFYMFARTDSLGQGADQWRDWSGDKGTVATVRLPMTLRNVGDWTFTLGIHGPGSLLLTDLKIIEGNGRKSIPAVAGIAPNPGSPPEGMRLPTGPVPFTIAPPAPGAGAPTLSATDFGLRSEPENGPHDDAIAQKNGIAFAAAIDACRAKGAARLVIPRGVYRFLTDAPLRIEGLHDFSLDANGSEFVIARLHGGAAIEIANCRRSQIRNLFVDWDWNVAPLSHLVRVKAISPDRTSVDVMLPDNPQADLTRVAAQHWLDFWPMDPTLFRCIPGAREFLGKNARVEALGEGTLRVHTPRPVGVTVGNYYAVRHYDYEMPAFHLSANHNLLLDGVTIYSMPGMGWLNNGDQDHWELRNCRIVPRPGTRRPFTTGADGFHSSESHGYLVLENCEFSHSGDDEVNIHDNCGSGVVRIDDHTLLAPPKSSWHAHFAPGDIAEVDGPDYAPLGYTSPVVSTHHDDSGATVVFEKALPAVVPSNAIVWNHHYDTRNVRITGCSFHDGGVRGIILAAHDALVENCIFDHTYSGAFQFHTEIESGWSEGHGASNIVFRNNIIRGVNARGMFDGSALYAIAVLPAESSYPLFHDILIENNLLEDSFGPAMEFSACHNVVVRGNTFAASIPLPDASPLRDTIVVERSSNMALGGNTWVASPYLPRPGVTIDPKTTSAISASGNVLRKGAVAIP